MKKNKDFVLKCLKNKDMSASDFVEQYDMLYNTVYGYLKNLKSSGLIHISSYQFRHKSFAAKFRLGKGKDAKRPTVKGKDAKRPTGKNKSSCGIKTKVAFESGEFRFFREMSKIWDEATAKAVRGWAC